MAVKSLKINATQNDDFRSISRPDWVNQWKYDFDGLDGVDTLSFDRLPRSEFKVYQDKSGIHVDSVSSASHMIYVTLKNVEQLKFSNGRTTVDLSSLFPTTPAKPNTIPTGASSSVSLDTSATYVLRSSDFGFEDADLADKLTAVSITRVPATGTLQLNNKNLNAATQVKAADIDAGKLVFIPAKDAAGTRQVSMSFKVSDGIAWSPSEYSLDFDLTFTNQAPVVQTAISKPIKITEGKALSYTIPKSTFTDPDRGDTITYRIDDLPAGLSLNPTTGKLSGTVGYDAASGTETALQLTATDREGASTSTSIKLAIANQPKITGSAAADQLVAGDGNDLMTGLSGNDTLVAGAGNDTLSGGAGADILTLGTGADVVVMDALPASGLDTVTDFVSGEDRLQLSAKRFPQLKGIKDLSNYLHVGADVGLTPQQAKHYLLFDPTTGVLSYDADANGPGVATVMVQLTGVSTLDAGDLFVR